MKRRELIRGMTLGALGCALPGWSGAAASDSRKARRMLLVELNGGNDGLNTVIPYSDPAYARLRPSIHVPRDQVVQLGDGVGLHPALAPLKPLFDQRELAIVQGLGYTPPNRSHFRSISIWDTASGPDRIETTGWLATLGPFAGDYAADAVVIGRNPGPVTGGSFAPLVLSDSNAFVEQASAVVESRSTSSNPALQHLLELERQIAAAAGSFARDRPQVEGPFPNNPFGRDLEQAARLLAGSPEAPIVKVALSGFDTHAAQPVKHRKLLEDLAEGLVAFRRAMVASGDWNQVLVMTYSEFGRRVQENANHGTDHGAAAPHFVMGGRVNGGLLGAAPNLGDLANGDVRSSIDYRDYYGSILQGWWGGRSEFGASGAKLLPLVRG